jgi:methylisocitrate lyase
LVLANSLGVSCGQIFAVTIPAFAILEVKDMDVSPGLALRNATANQTLQVPGAPSALAARLIEQAGFGATYLSGATLSANTLGMPDVGLLTLPELVQHVTYLTRNVTIPVIVDADTGFGEVINVLRTVVELEAAGAAAMQLEDQVLPKRCGHLSGKTLVDPSAMCAKIYAACEARFDPDFVIIARTDARDSEGLDAAIERALSYVDAGADWIFPEALASEEEFKIFAEEMPVPLIANMTEFGKSPLLPHSKFAKLGYAAVLYPVTLMRIAMRAMEAALGVINSTGSQETLLHRMQTRAELYELLDYDGFQEKDRHFFDFADEDEIEDGEGKIEDEIEEEEHEDGEGKIEDDDIEEDDQD